MVMTSIMMYLNFFPNDHRKDEYRGHVISLRKITNNINFTNEGIQIYNYKELQDLH